MTEAFFGHGGLLPRPLRSRQPSAPRINAGNRVCPRCWWRAQPIGCWATNLSVDVLGRIASQVATLERHQPATECAARPSRGAFEVATSRMCCGGSGPQVSRRLRPKAASVLPTMSCEQGGDILGVAREKWDGCWRRTRCDEGCGEGIGCSRWQHQGWKAFEPRFVSASPRSGRQRPQRICLMESVAPEASQPAHLATSTKLPAGVPTPTTSAGDCRLRKGTAGHCRLVIATVRMLSL